MNAWGFFGCLVGIFAVLHLGVALLTALAYRSFCHRFMARFARRCPHCHTWQPTRRKERHALDRRAR